MATQAFQAVAASSFNANWAFLLQDGWLMTFEYDETQNMSELVIVTTPAMLDEPIARILMPQRIPYSFHGAWIEERHHNLE